MNQRRFYSQLGLLTGGILGVLFLIQLFPVFHSSFQFSLISLLFFLLLIISFYYPSVSAAKSSDKNAFTRLILGFTLAKIFLTIGLIITFYKVFDLKSNYFLIPFFFIYIAFTVFEAVFMTRLGKR